MLTSLRLEVAGGDAPHLWEARESACDGVRRRSFYGSFVSASSTKPGWWRCRCWPGKRRGEAKQPRAATASDQPTSTGECGPPPPPMTSILVPNSSSLRALQNPLFIFNFLTSGKYLPGLKTVAVVWVTWPDFWAVFGSVGLLRRLRGTP